VKHRDFQRFSVDVSRYRPVLTVLLAGLTVMPSVWEAATGNLSFMAVLGRLALSLLVCGALVWVTTGVMLHYARVQVRARSGPETSLEIEP
jgi:uncharacterized membrane protein